MNDVNHLFIGDCKIILPALKAQSVQTVVTSPPYFGLRDYGVEGQIGQEASVEAYVKNLVAVFHEVKRVLKDDGTLWLNLGDSYAGSNKNRNAEGKSYAIKEGYRDSTHTGRRMGGYQANSIIRMAQTERFNRSAVAGCICTARRRLVFTTRYNLAEAERHAGSGKRPLHKIA